MLPVLCLLFLRFESDTSCFSSSYRCRTLGFLIALVVIPTLCQRIDGVNEYEQTRATLISEAWGFVGFAADIYGSELQTVENITERSELANLYRGNAALFSERIQTAVDLIKEHPSVNPDQIAIFGYCFGGTGIIQYGLLGFGAEDVAALVSFHGGLSFIPEPDAVFGPKILILSGGDDDASSDIMDLEITLDNATATWEITRYSGIEHAFTKWDDGEFAFKLRKEFAFDRCSQCPCGNIYALTCSLVSPP
jgi:dienelactone hydrolase